MARVTGIGGFFFRASDPAALADWYERHLGIDAGETVWRQEAGFTVFAPFPQTTDYFGSEEKGWMLNFRDEDLDSVVADLEAEGIAVERRDEWDMPEVGRFARIHDPDGNPIELWEPAR